jgi:PEP-CTERM motif
MTLNGLAHPRNDKTSKPRNQPPSFGENTMLKLSIVMAAVVAAAAAGTASAHTVSIGVYNAGAPGSVTLAMGTYSHGAPIFEGSMALIAGPSTTAPVAFSSVTTMKPMGLIDGVNNFYADTPPSSWGSGNADAYTTATDVNVASLGSVMNWQELTFTGLAPGVYTYQLSGMFSANWTNINSFTNDWTGTIIISGSTAGVPEPGSLALAGLALAGVAAVTRRRAA